MAQGAEERKRSKSFDGPIAPAEPQCANDALRHTLDRPQSSKTVSEPRMERQERQCLLKLDASGILISLSCFTCAELIRSETEDRDRTCTESYG